MGIDCPSKINNDEFRFDAFKNGKTVYGKKKNRLPAMGWNSWNAFGSGNTQKLTQKMADCIVSLGLDKFGYKYVVLDDGCYKSERINGELSNEEVKFPDGFKALSDYIHEKGLKFGMYNDIGTNLCAGAAVGTCGHEKTDAQSYINWGVDFLKIDNCYYLWDNATFSNPENARYTYAPKIKSVLVKSTTTEKKLSASKDGIIRGDGPLVKEDYVYGIGTFDGTNTGTSPVGERSGELTFEIKTEAAVDYELFIEYATDRKPMTGEWLQVAVDSDDKTSYFYDDLLPATKDADTFELSLPIKISLETGKNTLRLMNHRRQENTLDSYAKMLESLNTINPDNDIVLSICEWGKTQPHNWGYKVGDSWRILNDITFRVGSDGNPGFGEWNNPGTQSVCSQYNKAVIMDEFSGLDKGWNDPDMLMIGMDGLTLPMNKTHFTMWCMMNSPLMLGMDLRRLKKDDEYYKIITNKALIALNQDSLGIQAKRIWTSVKCKSPDTEYIVNDSRSDLIAKPLSDGSIALSYINLNDKKKSKPLIYDIKTLKEKLGDKVPQTFKRADSFTVTNLWNGEVYTTEKSLIFGKVAPCDNITIRVTPVK